MFTQDDEIFTSDLTDYVSKCKSKKRQKEILLSRLLSLYILQTNNVNIDFFNSVKKRRDILLNNFFSPPAKTIYLSISHSHTYLTIALSSTSQIGIDIEYPYRGIEKIKQYFVNKKNVIFEDNNSNILLSLWTVYEALSKLNISEENQQKIIEKMFIEVNKRRYQKLRGLLFQYFSTGGYEVFVWKDSIVPGPGCLISRGENISKINFYIIEKSQYIIEKPCKINLARLLTCYKKAEITL